MAIAAAAALATISLAPAAQAGPTAPLGHSGRWITDAKGRVAILHGVNMVNKQPPYAPSAQGFGDDDAAFLQRYGFDTVRLGLIYKAVEPTPGTYADAYLNAIAATEANLASMASSASSTSIRISTTRGSRGRAGLTGPFRTTGSPIPRTAFRPTT